MIFSKIGYFIYLTLVVCMFLIDTNIYSCFFYKLFLNKICKQGIAIYWIRSWKYFIKLKRDVTFYKSQTNNFFNRWPLLFTGKYFHTNTFLCFHSVVNVTLESYFKVSLLSYIKFKICVNIFWNSLSYNVKFVIECDMANKVYNFFTLYICNV